MRHSALLFLLGLLLLPVAQGQPYWNNPSMYRLNKVQPHDRIVPDGAWHLSLNGTWKLARFGSPQAASRVALTAVRFDDTIRVPHRGHSSASTAGNAVWLYARDFRIPAHWHGRRVIAKFGAVGTAMYLYVNGSEVGYSQDSRTPAEWDITKYLHEGTNRMTVKVLHWCDGSRLEHLDGHSAVGITRGVELYSVPYTYITDIKVIADLDTATFRHPLLDIMVDLNREVRGGSVEATVCGVTLRKRFDPGDWFLSLAPQVGDITPWTDTTPVLYPLTVRLLDAAGNEIERITKRIGFRHVDIRGGQLRLNGKPVEVRGVCLCAADCGDSPAAMREEIRLMKEMGVNAVRTALHPASEQWYDLCDSAGLLVWDEANVACRDTASPASQKDWLNPILDRVYNMYKRDRNHPCVLAWSLGSGGGNGVCFEEAYRFLKGKDDTRPVVYAGAATAWNTDIVCAPDLPLESLSRYARSRRSPRPCILSAYCRGMGGLQTYWDTIARHPRLQGGFLASLPPLASQHPALDEMEAVYTRGARNITVAMAKADYPRPNLKYDLRIHKSNTAITLANKRFSLTLNAADGSITAYTVDGRELLAAPLRWNFWRQPTDDDRANPLGARAWQGLDQLKAEVLSLTTLERKKEGVAEVQMLMRLTAPDGATMRLRQIVEVNPLGQMQLSYLLVPGGQFRTLPRMGLTLGLDTAYSACSFFGNIHPTYPDRRAARRYGLWYKATADLAAPPDASPLPANREARYVRFLADGAKLDIISPHWQADLNFSLRRPSAAGEPPCGYSLSVDHLVAPVGSSVDESLTLSGSRSYAYSFLFDPQGTTPSGHTPYQPFPPHPLLDS